MCSLRLLEFSPRRHIFENMLKTRNIKNQFVAELNNIDYYKYDKSRFDLMWFQCSPMIELAAMIALAHLTKYSNI